VNNYSFHIICAKPQLKEAFSLLSDCVNLYHLIDLVVQHPLIRTRQQAFCKPLCFHHLLINLICFNVKLQFLGPTEVQEFLLGVHISELHQ